MQASARVLIVEDDAEMREALSLIFSAQGRQRPPHSAVRSIGPEALRLLTEAVSSGNVREPATVIERGRLRH